MFYRLFILLLTLTALSAANDKAVFNPKWLDNKFYVGVTAGYTNLLGQLNRTFNVQTSDRAISVGEGQVVPGGFFGYQKLIDNTFYIAPEIFYHHTNISIDKEEHTFPAFVNYHTNIKLNNSWGAAGRIGVLNRGNIFYLKGGVVFSRFVLGFKDNNDAASMRSSVVRKERGLLLGLGMDYFLTKSVSFGMEYETARYQSMKFDSNNAGSFSFKPVTHSFMVRFKYMLD